MRSKRPATEGSEVNLLVMARCTTAERSPVCEAVAEHEVAESHGVNPSLFSPTNSGKIAPPLIATFLRSPFQRPLCQ